MDSKLILVIDDSPTVRKIIETTLQREGYTVMSFSDGIAAMHWLAQPNAPTPDLITLDIILPNIDGFEVARRLKANTRFKDTVIVMVSRRDTIIDHLQGRLAGAAKDRLSKPFKTQDLLAIVKKYIGNAPEQSSEYS